jgi:peptidoglycan/LPS O-acetylase OafA/YrhL
MRQEIHPLAAAQRRGVFTTFDGLRGVAALLVVSRHVGPFFGPLNSPESFLAVDMFFLLSGFVIANAYASRLAKGGFVLDFLKIRLIRLYPLYLAGLVVAVVLRLYMRGQDGDPWTLHMLVPTALLALVMLGGPAGETTHGYSLNSPSWTLLPEIGMNMLYAVLFRWLTTPVLVTLIGAGAIGMVIAELSHGSLDVGYADHAEWATPFRMGFSFFFGVLLHRRIGDQRRDAPLTALACVAAVILALMWHPSDAFKPVYELGVALVGFPLLITIAARAEAPGRLGEAFRWLGLTSYAVYTLHAPTGMLVYQLLRRTGIIDVWYSAPFSGFVFLGFIAVFAWGVDRVYDQPVRRWLTRRFLPARPTSVVADAKAA